jgi:hypothetical protein
LKESLAQIGKPKFSVNTRVERFLANENAIFKKALLFEYISDPQLQENFKTLLSAYVSDAKLYGNQGRAIKERRMEQLQTAAKAAGME